MQKPTEKPLKGVAIVSCVFSTITMAGGDSVPEADTGDPSRIQALGSAVWVCGSATYVT